MLSKRSHTAIAIALILLGFAASVGLTRHLESASPPLPQGYEDEDLGLQASKLKGFVFGAEGLIADWYWMNSLQYIGKKISAVDANDEINLDDLRSLNPKLLYPYLNNTVEIDPRFIPAYSYGAIVLPAINPSHAIALAEKGIANNPDEWRLHQYLGYIHWRQGNFEKAAEVYTAGSLVPGVPDFMPMMAAAMKTKGGSRETAREIYQGLIDETQHGSSANESVKLRLLELDSLDERDAINAALDLFKNKNGRCTGSWSELMPTLKDFAPANGKGLRIDGANNIVDPSGAPYILDKQNCEVNLDRARTKIPLQ